MVTIIYSMKDAIKLTIVGLIVLLAAGIPVTLFSALWNYGFYHIPTTESALKVAFTLGCILIGGWATFICTMLGVSLSAIFIKIVD